MHHIQQFKEGEVRIDLLATNCTETYNNLGVGMVHCRSLLSMKEGMLDNEHVKIYGSPVLRLWSQLSVSDVYVSFLTDLK